MASQQDFSDQFQSLLAGRMTLPSPKIAGWVNQWFKNLTVRQKISLSYMAALSVAITGVGAGILFGVQYQRQAWQGVEYSRTELNLLTRLKASISQTHTQQQQLILLAEHPEAFVQEYRHLQEHQTKIEQFRQDLVTLMAEEGQNRPPHQQELPILLQQSRQVPASYFQELDEVVQLVKSLNLQSAEEVETARHLLLDFTNSLPAQQLNKLIQELTILIERSYAEAETTAEQLKSADSLSFKIIALSMLGSVTTAALLIWYVSRALAQPLQNVTMVARQALSESNFDLQAPVTTGDEIGVLTTAVNQLLRGVRQLLIEQKTSETALRDSEQKFRSLYEMTSDAVMLLGEEGFLDCNSAALRMLGCTTKADVIGKYPIDFSPTYQASGQLSAELVEQHVNQVYQQGSDRFEWLTQRRDGSTFFAEVLLCPVDFGDYQLVQAVIRDITAHKQLEAALRERANQLRTQNQVLNQLTKHPSVTRGDLTAAIQVIAEATATTLDVGRVSVWVYDETKTWLECLNSFQQSAAHHRPKLRLNSADYPIYFEALEQGGLIVASDAHSHPQTREFVETYFKPFGIVSIIDSPICMAGRIVGVLCVEQLDQPRQWSPEDENFIRAIADITVLALEARDRQSAKLALQQKQQELQQTLEELRHTQTQMVQSEKMSSLGQLVAGVAHEINNPVNFIHGNINHAEAYIKDLLDLVNLYQQHYPQPISEIEERVSEIDLAFLQQDLPKLLTSMRSGSDRIREIVQSLRKFSRLDEAEFKTVDIHEGLDSTLMILQYRLKEKPDQPGIQVVRDYGCLPAVECYPGQLNQVFMNLLANAIDAVETPANEFFASAGLPNGGCRPHPRIHICTKAFRAETTGEDWIAIHISDNGGGIPESVRSRLFDPFFTTKPVGKGTGLGLSISYQIITEKHGGTLHCHSVVDQGTEFVIQLPVYQHQRAT
jgi:PAS domain S-box-containing protein